MTPLQRLEKMRGRLVGVRNDSTHMRDLYGQCGDKASVECINDLQWHLSRAIATVDDQIREERKRG